GSGIAHRVRRARDVAHGGSRCRLDRRRRCKQGGASLMARRLSILIAVLGCMLPLSSSPKTISRSEYQNWLDATIKQISSQDFSAKEARDLAKSLPPFWEVEEQGHIFTVPSNALREELAAAGDEQHGAEHLRKAKDLLQWMY